MSSFANTAANAVSAHGVTGPLPALDLSSIIYRLEMPADGETIEAIAEDAFGPGRYVRAAERVRELYPIVSSLCFVATDGEAIAGSVRMTDFPPAPERALMLGPLAVRPHLKGRGIGKALMRHAAKRAKDEGYRAIYLVGDAPYYALLGYRAIEPGRVVMPRPADPSRVLMLEL
ncbi:N-acetyltransferase [Fulvimarina sp. MAC8]|uniref:GNAT family N-acetyltransferase n=1 Tax=Fulvimarina sp. MAC8 TaxID=3162874 RepID=UPI0032EC46FD